MARNVSRRGFIQGLAALGAGAKTGALGQMAGKALEGAAPAAAEAIAKPVSNDMVAAVANYMPRFDEWAKGLTPEQLRESRKHAAGVLHQPMYEQFVRDAANSWGDETGAVIPHGDVDHFLKAVPRAHVRDYMERLYTLDSMGPEEAYRMLNGTSPEELLKYNIPGMTPEQMEMMHDHSGQRDAFNDLHQTAVEHADEHGLPMPKGAAEIHEDPGYPVDYMDQIRRSIQNGHPNAAGHLARLVSDDMPSVGDVLRHLFPDEAERLAVSEKLTTAPQITDQRAVLMAGPARDPVPVKRQEDE